MAHSHSKKKSVIKPVLYAFLSFALAFMLFLLSICLVARITLFSQDFMLTAMAECDYYSMIKDELRTQLKNLGHASGLNDDLVDTYVESLDIRQIETEYISAFYSGETTLVETNEFKQTFKAAIDQYVEDNNIDKSKANENNIIFLVDEAAGIYVNCISIPFFSVIANYFYKLSTPLNIAAVALFVFSLAVAAIIFFTNEFRHRRYRYLCYACTTSFISVTVIPLVVFISKYIEKINLGTRSLYNLFVTYFTSLFKDFWVFSGVFLFLSILTFVLYYRAYNKAVNG